MQMTPFYMESIVSEVKKCLSQFIVAYRALKQHRQVANGRAKITQAHNSMEHVLITTVHVKSHDIIYKTLSNTLLLGTTVV